MQEEPLTVNESSPEDQAVQEALRERGPLPEHVAIIMDGNGRWAKAQGKPRVSGHRAGVASVREIAEVSAKLGIKYLTLYTFSTENWQRPFMEVNALMQILIRTLQKEKETLLKNNIRLSVMGDIGQLPEACRLELDEALAATAPNSRMTLNLALSYSGRWDLVQAARTLAARVRAGELEPEQIDEAALAGALSTAGTPDPDLLIRTGGDFRVSNFLLWEIAYSEMYITDCFWPAFRRAELYAAIRSFQDRDRRFGRV